MSSIILNSYMLNKEPCPVCGSDPWCKKHFFGFSEDLVVVEQTNELEDCRRTGPLIAFDPKKHIPLAVKTPGSAAICFYRIYINDASQTEGCSPG